MQKLPLKEGVNPTPHVCNQTLASFRIIHRNLCPKQNNNHGHTIRSQNSKN